MRSIGGVALLALVCGCSTPLDWHLVWSDEFDDEGLPDSTRWSYAVGGHGWGNREMQFYTEAREQNAHVRDGSLFVTALREPCEDNAYTSARLITRDKGDWRYGRFEIRARLPNGRGTWPAIWIMPWYSRTLFQVKIT